MSYYERREKIKEMLKIKGKISGRELADEFQVSKNTILKDINAITPTFPICTTYGREGGYEYCGNGRVELKPRQAQYLHEFMERHANESDDEQFREILAILKNAQAKNM